MLFGLQSLLLSPEYVFCVRGTLFFYNYVVKYTYQSKRSFQMANLNMYDEVVSRYYESIRMYCLEKLRNNESAKDCTQEVFLLLHKKWNTLKGYDNISAWLHRTADNIMNNMKRKSFHEIPTDNEELDIPVTENFYEGNDLLDIIGAEDYNLLLNYYIAGTDKKVIADKIGISEVHLRKRIERIKNKINKYLSKSDNNQQ